MLKRNIYLSMIAVAMLIQSCNLSSNISTPVANVTPSTTGTNLTMTATPTFTPIANSDLFLPECDKTPKSGLPTESAGGTYQSWYRYTNESYGFSFAFPPDWDVIENKNYVCVRLQATPTINLIVGFKRNTEAITIQRSGVGAGEITTRGTVGFLGHEISKDILVYQGKDKAVLYNNATAIRIESLVFTLSIDDFQPDYNTASLSKEIQATADKIVESFSLEK